MEIVESLSKVLLNDKNNELSDGTNFWDKNRQLTTDEIDCYLQKIAANAKNTEVNYPTGLYVPYSTRTHLEDALNENIKRARASTRIQCQTLFQRYFSLQVSSAQCVSL